MPQPHLLCIEAVYVRRKHLENPYWLKWSVFIALFLISLRNVKVVLCHENWSSWFFPPSHYPFLMFMDATQHLFIDLEIMHNILSIRIIKYQFIKHLLHKLWMPLKVFLVRLLPSISAIPFHPSIPLVSYEWGKPQYEQKENFCFISWLLW